MSTLNLVIEDADGDKSTLSWDFSGSYAGNVTELVSNAWGVVNPLVNGELAGGSVTIEADITDIVNAAAATISDVQEKAEFTFKSLAGYLKRITLPTFIETFFTGSGAGKTVDLTQSAVTAFVAMIEDGVADNSTPAVEVNFTTSHGEDLMSLASARQSWGKERR